MGVTEWCDVSEGSALWELLSGVMLVRGAMLCELLSGVMLVRGAMLC